MNRIVTAIVLAAVSTAASWAVRRALSRAAPPKRQRQLEVWENEGGALARHRAAIETSQVPR